MVFEGFTVSSKDRIYHFFGGLRTSFSEVLGYLGCHFGGLGGSWDHCRISMEFRSPQGTTKILSRAGVEGDYPVSGAQ